MVILIFTTMLIVHSDTFPWKMSLLNIHPQNYHTRLLFKYFRHLMHNGLDFPINFSVIWEIRRQLRQIIRDRMGIYYEICIQIL